MTAIGHKDTEMRKRKQPAENEIPAHWSELDGTIKRAIIKQANDRIFWEGAMSRLGGAGKIATSLLAIAALLALFRTGLAEWILGAGK